MLIEVQIPDDMLAEDVVDHVFPSQDIDLADVQHATSDLTGGFMAIHSDYARMCEVRALTRRSYEIERDTRNVSRELRETNARIDRIDREIDRLKDCRAASCVPRTKLCACGAVIVPGTSYFGCATPTYPYRCAFCEAQAQWCTLRTLYAPAAVAPAYVAPPTIPTCKEVHAIMSFANPEPPRSPDSKIPPWFLVLLIVMFGTMLALQLWGP